MPPNKPQSSYSKRPVRRLRLPKIGPSKTKGLFEEYFYVCVVLLFVIVAILGRAGGLSGYDALVVGLWVAGFTWFAGQLKNYFKEKSKPAREKNPTRTPEAPVQAANGPLALPPGMKPMIGPQWPLKTGPGSLKPAERPAQAGATPAAPGSQNKPVFIYERPTLPDRKPKLPNNWPGQKNKKPKR
jgi:hypothetical protein